MKYKFKILILLIVFNQKSFGSRFSERLTDEDKLKSVKPAISIPGNASPNFSTSSSENTHEVVEGLKKKFKFDPILEINQNRGSLSSQIQIPLFINGVGLSSIDLNYNHTNQSNIGLGIGFNWSLPFIQTQKDFSKNSKYSTVGLLGSLELIESDESIEKYKKILNHFGSIFGQVDQLKLKIYRPEVESNGTLFIQILNHSNLKWAALTLNGGRWVFNSQGQPIHFISKNFQKLNFIWN
nr:hypothetical protein [Pseudobdellovibrionaceae bacterium]